MSATGAELRQRRPGAAAFTAPTTVREPERRKPGRQADAGAQIGQACVVAVFYFSLVC